MKEGILRTKKKGNYSRCGHNPRSRLSGIARAKAHRVAAEYCLLMVDRRQSPPDCKECSLVNYRLDCRNNPVGTRDVKSNAVYAEVFQA